MIVNNPVGGKAKDTEKKITETEVKNEIKHRIFHHTEVMTKLAPNSLFEAAKINEGDDGDDIIETTPTIPTTPMTGKIKYSISLKARG